MFHPIDPKHLTTVKDFIAHSGQQYEKLFDRSVLRSSFQYLLLGPLGALT